jgi:hypothetical protein
MRRSRTLLGWAVVVLSLCTGGVIAQALPGVLQEQVASLPSAQRDLLYRRAASLQAMTAQQRQQFERRLAEWNTLGEAERRERRERWQAWQALPVSERAQLQAAARAFAALPVQAQLDLRARYARLDESQRHGWLLGPGIGVHWQRLQPLLMQVPAEQRLPLLSALRAMTPQQREALGVLAQRTPPQMRNRLRSELLAVPAANRGSWLMEQLDR